MTQYLKFLLFTGMILVSVSAFGQKKVRLKQADTFRGGSLDGESFQKFIGNVIFTQKETTIYCDSAIMFRNKDIVEAFGHVKILNGDSTTITGEKLTYDGNTEVARLRQNVIYRKLGSMTLYTDNLDYYIKVSNAKYFEGGRLVDSTSVLTSESGTYDDNTGIATFKKNVVATFPDGVMRSEALKYNTRTGIVYFIVPTTLTNKDGTVANYTEGEYNTRSKSSIASKGVIESADYTIKADLLQKSNNMAKGIGNVVLTGKKNNIVITGDEALMYKDTGVSKVYGDPLMKRPFDVGDTLYLSADTLVSIDSKIESEKRLLAYGNVKIYKLDLQGKSDSLVYFTADSVIRFYQNPILWSDDNQMTADTISVFIENGTISRMEMDVNSFVITQDTLKNFNQIKGRDMVSYFRDGALDHVNVDGNCESIFFALDEEEVSVVGMNKMISSNMNIFFKNNTASKVTSLIKPDASFIPPHELKKGGTTLRGFNWQADLRPTLSELLGLLPIQKDTLENKKEPTATEIKK